MRTTSLFRRHPRMIVALAGAVVAASLLGLPAAPASAAGGGIVQVNPTEGAVLAGSAFTDQLQVSGASGTVTYTQSSGSDVTVSSAGQVTAPGTLAVGTYSAAGTDSDSSGDTGNWTYTLTVVAPAPADFATTVVGVYQSEYSVAEQLGNASSIQSVSQYSSTVNQLNPTQLGELYNAVSQNPEWFQIPSLMQTVASDVNPTSSAAISRSALRAGGATALGEAATARGGTATARHAVAKSARTGRLLLPHTPEGEPVAPFQPATCTETVPDAAVFALQIVVDAAQGAFNILTATAVAFADAVDAQVGIGIAAAVAGGVLLAAQIVHDVLAFEQQLYNECEGNNEANEVDNIDNTTVQNYGLLTSLATTVAQIQTTNNSVLTDVQDIQNQLTALQTTLIQTITTDTQTLQTTIGSDTQAVTTQIETDIGGLHSDLTTVENDMQTVSQNVITQVNTDSSAVQSSLSSDLTKILNETDSTAGSLTTLVSSGNQQIINLIKGNFSTEQSQYDQNLTFMIERALGTYGSYSPPVMLMTPASQGGLLDSTPVGVKEVVSNDINTIVNLGGKVTPSAIDSLNKANAELAAGEYVLAYDDYASSYESFAG